MSLMSRGSVITSRQWYNGTVQMCERNKPRSGLGGVGLEPDCVHKFIGV